MPTTNLEPAPTPRVEAALSTLPGVPSTAGLILLRVAYDLDQSGADSVVVTQADLGRSLNATVRTIRRGLRALSDLGLIETAFVYDDGFRTGTRVSLGDSFPTSA